MCYKCSVGCKTCSSSTVCTVCLDGFFLSGTTCTACTYPCTKCTSGIACTSNIVDPFVTPKTFKYTFDRNNKCTSSYSLGYIYGGYTLVVNVTTPSVSGAPALALDKLTVTLTADSDTGGTLTIINSKTCTTLYSCTYTWLIYTADKYTLKFSSAD